MEETTQKDMTFQSENSWMVQLLSLATIGVLAFMQISPVVGM